MMKKKSCSEIAVNSRYAAVATVIFLMIFPVTGNSQIAGVADPFAVTPSHVLGAFDLASRCTDVILNARGIKEVKAFTLLEKGLRPMHPYNMAAAAADMIIEFENKEKLRPMPRIVVTPRELIPADVRRMGEILLAEIRRIAAILHIENLPEEEHIFEKKTPSDVFGKALEIFIKFSILSDREKITPNETYAQMVRIVSDVKTVLSHIDPAERFRIDAPVSSKDLTPGHVFKECLLIREDINMLRKHFNMETIPIPEIQANFQLHPADVFIQTQIIIAELNLLKMGTGTISATPLAIPVTEKNPSDVHQQAALARYLLGQVKQLQEMVAGKK